MKNYLIFACGLVAVILFFVLSTDDEPTQRNIARASIDRSNSSWVSRTRVGDNRDGGKIANPPIRKLLNKKNTPKSNYSYFYDSRTSGALPYYLTSNNGGITTGAAEAAKLTQFEKTEVESALDAAFRRSEDDFLSRLIRVDSESHPENGVTVFRIPASPDRAEMIMGDLRTAISNIVGLKRGSILTSCFDVDACVVGLGRKDVRLEIKVPPKDEKTITLINYEFTDPDSGKSISSGQSSIRAFRARFGDVIDFATE